MNNEILEKIAINIPTEIFYNMVEYIKNQDFNLKYEYLLFDKAIDLDIYIFEKDNQSIFLIWDIWDEGEILTNDLIFKELSEKFNIEFQFGKENYLQKVKKGIEEIAG